MMNAMTYDKSRTYLTHSMHKYSSKSFCEITCEQSIKYTIFYNSSREYAYML